MIVGKRSAGMKRRLGRKSMEELPVTEKELKQLLKTVDKVQNLTLCNKIVRKYNKHTKSRVKLLRKIAYNARREKEQEEELARGIVPLTENIFVEQTIPTSMESVTIDMIRMLKGTDKKKMLIAWHEWKARQKAVDVLYVNREKRRIWRTRAIKKDPEGFYARQRKYHQAEQERKHNSPEWIATHSKPRVKQTLEETKIKRKLYQKELWQDPEWRAKKNEQKKEYYYNKNKDNPEWLAKHERRKKRHQKLVELEIARAKRREARIADKLVGQDRKSVV